MGAVSGIPDGKSGGVHGVRVNNAHNVGTLTVNPQMHLDLGGGLEAGICFQHVAVTVDFANVFGCHESLGHARRSAEELVFTDLDRNVSVVCRDHSAVVNSLTYIADFLLYFVDLKFCHGNISILFY